MKSIKYLLYLIFVLVATMNAFGQITTQAHADVVIASQTINNQNGFSIITGSPYLGITENGENAIDPQIRFPWDVLYLYETFSDDAFEISKGYFSDKIRINWTIRNNRNLITHFNISRRVFNSVEMPYIQIASLPSNVTEFEDFYVEGGVLYEYIVEAIGIVDISEKYKTYNTGIGFRLPTAIVTGNVSFEGSAPVKNVSVFATPSNGSFSSSGAAARLEKRTWLEVNYLNKLINDRLTFQAWFKPLDAFNSNADPALDLFTLKSTSTENKTISAKLWDANTEPYLEIHIDGSIFKIHNYIPSGTFDARGNDILIPLSQFNTRFTHISVILHENQTPVLYLNGRKMDADYVAMIHPIAVDSNPNYKAPYFSVESSTISSDFNLQNNAQWANFSMGSPQTKSFIIEEVRLWRNILNQASIFNDYKRYISGDDSNLICYLKFDEGVGNIAYDYSYDSFIYNNNHAELSNPDFDTNVQGVVWVDAADLPDADQLGFFGVTDANGNYVINSIPYSGSGQSFEITPVFGVHKFEPNQQLIYIGTDNSIVNQINFTDVSSFTFKGRAFFDSRNVFKSFVEVHSVGSETPVFEGLNDGDEFVSGPGIIDEGYNFYEKNGLRYSKGEYWLNDAGTLDDINDDYLERYARIASEGATIYIDGQIVLDANNTPITTDNQGHFEIQVPIGNHYISVKKEGHSFIHNGRYPADSSTLAEFFEDNDEAVVFVDTTKVSLVGRVVGGITEADKPIGFGYNGRYTHHYTENGLPRSVIISSVNNIGIASMTLGYTPPSGNITEYTRFKVNTNEESGEYRVALLPLNYSINETNGLRISSNPNISLLAANEVLNLTAIVEQQTPTFESPDGRTLTEEPYHYKKSFTYRSAPLLRVTEQKGESEIRFENQTPISTEGFSHIIYRQFNNYEIKLTTIESYINHDSDPEVEYIVPLTEGELNINNNIALENSESVEVNLEDPSLITYKFRGGLPAITAPFTKSLSIKYLINGQEFEAEGYTNEAILLGGHSDGSQTFITAAPDIPDIILRDPPGSNSFASIESGQSISFTTETDFTLSGGTSTEFKFLLGAKFAAGGGLAGPVIETETTNSITAGISFESSSTDGKSLSKTYTFNQTISTSAEASSGLVGSGGDLYIGNSKNYFYGTYDDIDLRKESNGGQDDEIELTNVDGERFYISKQKAVYVSEEPTDTFFVFSQSHILNTLIPELEFFVESIENGAISEEDPGVLTRDEYEQQINLWRSLIRENERFKYIAKNDRSSYKEQLQDRVNSYIEEISDALAQENDPVSESRLISKLNASQNIEQAINNNFESNISLDSGVGEISRSIETSIVNSKTNAINLNVDQAFAFELGFAFNGFGLLNSTSSFINQDINTALTSEEENFTSISYVLSDNDTDNLLSIDVINAFDGNGPIFSLIGGRSSCPYIGEDLSLFYSNDTYDPNDQNIQELAENDREIISNATQQVEVPVLSVNVTEVHNVPETSNAEFTLLLENRSVSESNASLVLFVNPATNQSNAIINIPDGGIVFDNIPFGEPIEYELTVKKSISDIYEYEDIEVILASDCDRYHIFDTVSLSALFVPSCSSVKVSSPLENWVYNVDEAHNLDGSTNDMTIELSDFNIHFNSFKKLDLQYRRATSPTWTRLHTYYSTQAFFDEAVLSNETDISIIETSSILYSWDIIGQGLQDGEYEIRAVSTCSNNTDYISNPLIGTVDISSPVGFGTPSPDDGILTHGEDIKVRFSEHIFYNTAVSLIEIKAETNQLPINNDVSIHFNGENNTTVIENPYINTGDFSFEFWMDNSTLNSTATIVNQEDGFSIELQNNTLVFNFGDYTASGVFANDNLFHHYTFSYNSINGQLSIIQDGSVVNTSNAVSNLIYSFTNPITIGGNTFVGSIHDVRLWSKALNLTESFANIYTQYMGNESNLIGYWPMSEGNGNIARDKARFKHMQINNAEWAIKPKGNSYEFTTNQYLTLDNVSHVNLTHEMDFTLSFWVKTAESQTATLFSNGRGDGTDVVLADGTYNTWAVNLNPDGNLSLESEGNTYNITTTAITDSAWHHITLLMNRQGSLNTYVDNNLVTSIPNSGIKGFSSDRIWVGARGHKDIASQVTVDNKFSGKLDEIRLWNTLRAVNQISRDRYNEVDFNSTGLLLYLKMNQPDLPTGNGPRYYHATTNLQTTNSLAVLSGGSVNYSDDTPAIKPERRLISFQVNQVINGDEMILDPAVTSLASIEGQVLDITVHRMFDQSNNIQQSPITWTAFVNKNQVSWSIDGENDLVSTNVKSGAVKNLEITVRNSGGSPQPFSINNIPNWLILPQTSGVLAPSSTETIIASIRPDIGFGYFEHDVFLETDFGFDQKIQIQLEAIPSGPDWDINSQDFDFSLNIIGKIKINDLFSENPNNQIAAFVNGELRGLAQLTYDEDYKSHFVFLTAYSNAVSGEDISFSIWDASTGIVHAATIDGVRTLKFIENDVLGSKGAPKVFENSEFIIQTLPLNSGWSWVSFFVNGSDFSDINTLTQGLSLEESDRILSHMPSYLELYSNGVWSGTISANGGLKSNNMYKIRLAHTDQQSINIRGAKVDLESWNYEIQQNWNWLPYVVSRNAPINDALANFNPQEGDVIKSQNKFAIYDAISGWSGSLITMEAGKGYMLRSTTDQTFSYPSFIEDTFGKIKNDKTSKKQDLINDVFLQYQTNMNAVVKLPDGYTSVYAYDKNGILRGTENTQVVNNNELSFMTIYGDKSEVLTFHIGNGYSKKATSKTIVYNNNSVLGTVDNPIVIDEDVVGEINIYPNPFNDTLTIVTTEPHDFYVKIYDTLGKVLFDQEFKVKQDGTHFNIKLDIPFGIYFMKINMSGKSMVKKLIKN